MNRFLGRFGYTLIELLLVTSIVGVIPVTVYLEVAKRARAASCISNLRNIYMGMQMYEMDFERIPDAKFYPKSPTDPKSIVNVLENYIDNKAVYICPSMPAELVKRGLTYIWNDSHNNKLITRVPNRSSEWVMTEMTAAEAKIPPPHHGGYNILYFDGHAATVKEAVHLTPTPANLEEEEHKIFAKKAEEIGHLKYHTSKIDFKQYE